MKKLIFATIAIFFVTVATAQTKKIKSIANYQIVFVNTKSVTVYDHYRLVGTTRIDNLLKLIEADSTKNIPLHTVYAVNTIKGLNNIIDGNK